MSRFLDRKLEEYVVYDLKHILPSDQIDARL
jgi:hypothetical protein